MTTEDVEKLARLAAERIHGDPHPNSRLVGYQETRRRKAVAIIVEVFTEFIKAENHDSI